MREKISNDSRPVGRKREVTRFISWGRKEVLFLEGTQAIPGLIRVSKYVSVVTSKRLK
jgi:hypothetical protein